MISAGARYGIPRQLVSVLTVAILLLLPGISNAAAVSSQAQPFDSSFISVDRSPTWRRPVELSSRTSHLACKCPVGFYSGGGITILAPTDMCNSSAVTTWSGHNLGLNSFRVNMTTCHGCAQGCAVCSGPEEHECSRCGNGFFVNYHHEIIQAQTEEYSDARSKMVRSVRSIKRFPASDGGSTTVSDSETNLQLSTRALEEHGLLIRKNNAWGKKHDIGHQRNIVSRSLRDDEESSGFVTDLEIFTVPSGPAAKTVFEITDRHDDVSSKETVTDATGNKTHKQEVSAVPSLVSDVITVEREKRKHVGEMMQRNHNGYAAEEAQSENQNAQNVEKTIKINSVDKLSTESGTNTNESETTTPTGNDQKVIAGESETDRGEPKITVDAFEHPENAFVAIESDIKFTESDFKTTESETKVTKTDDDTTASEEGSVKTIPNTVVTSPTSGGTMNVAPASEEAAEITSGFPSSPWAFSCVARCPHGFYANSRRICRPCDRECDGCYGDGPERCLKCRHFKMASRCVWSCELGGGCVGGIDGWVDDNGTVPRLEASGEGMEEDEEGDDSTPAIYYAVPPLVIAVVALCLFVSFYRRRRKLRRSILWQTEGMNKRERSGSDVKAYYSPYLRGDKIGLAEFKNSAEMAKRPGNAYVYADRPLLHQKTDQDGFKNSHSWASSREEEDPLYETPENTWRVAPGHSRTHPRCNNGSVSKGESYLVPFPTNKAVSKSLDDCRTHSTKLSTLPIKLHEFRRASEDANSRGKSGANSDQNLSDYTQYLEVPYFEAPPLPERNSPSVDLDESDDHIYANIDEEE